MLDFQHQQAAFGVEDDEIGLPLQRPHGNVVPHHAFIGQAAPELGEAGQRKITQYTRYVTIALALINAIGYLFLFRAQGINFSQMQGVSEMLESIIVVLVLLTGAILIMWMGEVLTQRGIGNGMSLIIFVNIMAGLGPTLVREWIT